MSISQKIARFILFSTIPLLSISLLFFNNKINATQLVTIKTPPTLNAGLWLFNIEHRFYGPLQGEVADHFFGIDSGANINLSLGYCFNNTTLIDFSRARNEKEFAIDIVQTLYSAENWKGAIGLSYFNFKPYLSTSRNQGIMTYAALQMPQLFNSATPYWNVAYDHYYRLLGAGLGMDIALQSETSLIIEAFTSNQKTGPYSTGVLGLRYTTFGHQFVVTISNSSEIGLRRALTGSNTNNYTLGFSIDRILEL